MSLAALPIAEQGEWMAAQELAARLFSLDAEPS
jgi:hypothetical protein